jgi:CBS-domain-containing membrane protein
MPAYVDTSALVKRYVAEVDSAWVRRLLAHPAQAVYLACALTIRRITQEQGLPPPSFVVADTALRAAATAEGFVVENPLQHP